MRASSLLTLALLACADKQGDAVDSADVFCDILWYIDYDGDGFGSDRYTTYACDRPEGWVDNDDDCDDTNPLLTPLAVWYPDEDGDGFGAAGDSYTGCERPAGYVGDDSDCDDADHAVNPDAQEICNDDIDNDCDGRVPDACVQVVDSAHAVIYGEDDNDNLGGGLSQAGDVDGDGVSDFWVGATGYGSNAEGAVYLVPGPLAEGEYAITELSGARLIGESSDNVGAILAGGHDLDGDGQPDLAIGAHRAGAYNSGAVYFYFGELSGELDLADDAHARLDAEEIWNRLGETTHISADTTGDGLPDVVVGAPYRKLTEDERNAGAVYVLPGPIQEGWRYVAGDDTRLLITAEDAGDLLGQRITSADLDGDGVEELILGARIHSPQVGEGTLAEAGAAYLVEGGASGELSLRDLDAEDKLIGAAAGDNLSAGLAVPGDTDGDGIGDLLLGAPGSDAAYSNGGEVWLISGATPDVEAPLAVILGENNGDALGSSVRGAGDVNGDGAPDVLLSASGHGGLAQGSVYLFYGPLEGTLSAEDADARFDGEAEQDALGAGLLGVPDLTDSGDGLYDLVVSSVGANRGGTDSGALYLLFEVAE